MAARIVWWVLTLGILAVFHLTVTKETFICRYSRGCYFCKYPKATKDNCLEERICLNQSRWNVCIKYDQKDGKRTCGIQPPENIVGGCHAVQYNRPKIILSEVRRRMKETAMQVSLQSSSYVHFCGGVLIDNHWVLTAAHCVHKRYRTNAKDSIVVLGEFDLKRRSGKEQFQRIKHIFVHPNFHPGSKKMYDVALIQLENDAHYNEYVSPICLPSFNDIYSHDSCSITGWGETKGTGDKSRLRVLKVTVLAPDVCKNLWKGEIRRPKHHICVNYGLKGACHGDSGSPLSCVRSSDGRFVVAGVASWAHPTCQARDYPSVYTNIRTFVPWIIHIIFQTEE